jgi:hypothetical protein
MERCNCQQAAVAVRFSLKQEAIKASGEKLKEVAE